MRAAHYGDKRDASARPLRRLALSRGAVNVRYLFRRPECVISSLDRFIYRDTRAPRFVRGKRAVYSACAFAGERYVPQREEFYISSQFYYPIGGDKVTRSQGP